MKWIILLRLCWSYSRFDSHSCWKEDGDAVWWGEEEERVESLLERGMLLI